MKSEDFSKSRKGKREYLSNFMTQDLVRSFSEYFRREIKLPRIRMGDKQEIETLINEEALLLAMFLRNEKLTWTPRIASLNY